MKTKRTLKETVDTTKKSADTRFFTWFSRKASQVGEGGFLVHTMFFSTVDLLTEMPSCASSPRCAGSPVGLLPTSCG